MSIYNFQSNKATAQKFMKYTGGFWTGSSAKIAWLLTIGLAGSLVLKLVVDVALNKWNRWFFDALEQRDVNTAVMAMLIFAVLVVAIAAVGVAIVLTREYLQVRWRKWCTVRLYNEWLANQKYYLMSLASSKVRNPEYRISDDVRMATEPLTDFAIVLFTAVLSFFTFSVILWKVGGSYDLSIHGQTFEIPAFMLIGALVYGLGMSAIIPIVGKDLASVAATKNESEAQFRSEMIKIRENSNSILASKGESYAEGRLNSRYSDLVKAWWELVRQHGRLTWVTNSNSAMIPIIPLILCTPKYLEGKLSLGEVMQLASAFVQVQFAIGWLVDHFRAIAEWFASAKRITELVDELNVIKSSETKFENQNKINRLEAKDQSIELSNLAISSDDDQTLLKVDGLIVKQGERIAILGESGSGKTILAQAISGIWKTGSGSIHVPNDKNVLIIPSNPFVPEGNLLDVIAYPFGQADLKLEKLQKYMGEFGLKKYIEKLNSEEEWSQALSAGEKQLISMLRILTIQPDILILDDSFSLVDKKKKEIFFEELLSLRSQITIISLQSSMLDRDIFHRRYAISDGALMDESFV